MNKTYLNKKIGEVYLYTGTVAKDYFKNQKVKILRFYPNDGNTCEAFIQILGGKGGQVAWIPRKEIMKNLTKTNKSLIVKSSTSLN